MMRATNKKYNNDDGDDVMSHNSVITLRIK